MADKQKFTPKEIIKAFKDNAGFIHPTASQLGCAVSSVYNYMERYPEIGVALKKIRNQRVEYVESKLWKLIEEGNVASTIFFLKTQSQGKYAERKILVGDQDQPIKMDHKVEGKIEVDKLSNAELDTMIKEKLKEIKKNEK